MLYIIIHVMSVMSLDVFHSNANSFPMLSVPTGPLGVLFWFQFQGAINKSSSLRVSPILPDYVFIFDGHCYYCGY